TGRRGSGPGGTLVANGVVTVQATHSDDVTMTKADASAAGSAAAVGAGVAINIVQNWTTTADVGRGLTGTSVTIDANSTMISAPEATASASGGDSGDKKADEKADNQTANNPNTNTQGVNSTNTPDNNG